jgi:tape measure domain-containing protein
VSNFTFQVVADAAKADKEIDDVVKGLEKIETEAKNAGRAMSKEFDKAAASVRKAADEAKRAVTSTALGGMGNPVANQRAQTQQAMGTIGLGPAPKAAGMSMGGMAAAGGIAAAGVAAAAQLAAIDDEYINLSNSAMKFADAGHSVSDVLAEQRELAHGLNSSVKDTIGTYDAVRDATDGLNLTHAEQIRLTKTLGEAAQLGGKSMESAATAVQGLSVAFETGQDPARALRGIFKEFPDLTEQMTTGLGVSKKELLDMASDGRLSFEQLVRSMTTGTDVIDAKFGQRVKTWGQRWHEFTDAVERPISMEHLFVPFGTLDQAINRVVDDVNKLSARWSALRDAKNTSAIVGIDTAVRNLIDTGKAYLDTGLRMTGVVDDWRVANDNGAKSTKDHTQAIRDHEQALRDMAAANAAAREWMTRDRSIGAMGMVQAPGFVPQAFDTMGDPGEERAQPMDWGTIVIQESNNGKQAMDDLAKSAEDAAKRSQEAWASGMGSIAGSIAQMALKGEMDINKLGTQLFKLALQMAAMSMGGPGGAFLSSFAGSFGGFATGGQFMVGGSGGTDQNLVAFRASNNERVTIETPQQQRDGTFSGGGRSGTVIVNMQNDRRDLVQGFNSRDGAAVLVNLDRKYGTMRR